MTEKTYKTVDKSNWERGPWDNEPDKVEFRDPVTSLPCLIVRNPLGALCGYVGVPEGHPWYEKEYEEIDVRVHGGLTYSAFCTEGPQEESICHVGEDKVWWLGFDCCHLGDFTEMKGRFYPHLKQNPDIYRDIEYVKTEVRNLAKQAADVLRSSD